METYAVEEALSARFARPEYRRRGVVVIGPAAENLVRFGVVENNRWRSAGRTGPGTVMGSKKLKGVLFTGNRKRLQFDGNGVKEFSRNFLNTLRTMP